MRFLGGQAWPAAEVVGEAADGMAAALAIRQAVPDARLLLVSGTDRSETAAAIADVGLVRKRDVDANALRGAVGA